MIEFRLKEFIEELIDDYSVGEVLQAIRAYCLEKSKQEDDPAVDAGAFASAHAELEVITNDLLNRGI